jgi:hypothetical protein
MSTTYTITKNAQFNSLEIAFEGKPAEEIREALKALRFRWHSVKKVWYGYTDEATARAAIEGKATEAKKPEVKKAAPKAKTETVNKYGVKVGDIFRATWGWEQTNNNFFQVVALCGESSVRVREVYLPVVESEATGPMAENRVVKVVRDLLPAASHSGFIKDQEHGDIKKLKSYAADGVSNPQFRLSSYADAYFVSGDSLRIYESWYA